VAGEHPEARFLDAIKDIVCILQLIARSFFHFTGIGSNARLQTIKEVWAAALVENTFQTILQAVCSVQV
jgi:hypothetical protein